MTARRLVPFVGIGALGFVVQIAALAALTRWAHVPYPLAVALAVEAAIVHNFFWHDRWTWGDRHGRSVLAAAGRLVRFNGAAGAIGLAGNVLVTSVLVEGLALPVIAANVTAVGVMSLLNYVVADRWVFKPSARAGAAVMGVLACASAGNAQAAELKPETTAAFERYVRAVEERREKEARNPERFLSVDFRSPEDARALRARLRRGQIVAEPAGSDAHPEIPSGRVHHWRGYVFVPGVTVDGLVAAIDAAAASGESWQEDVLRTRLLHRTPEGYVVFLKLRREELVTALYNTEHVVTHARDPQGRLTTRSVSRRIVEIEERDAGADREKPIGADRGFLWRMNAWWRYEPAHGGVIVELESVTLSRDVPWGIRPLAEPVIRRIARGSMTRTLAAMRSRFQGSSRGRRDSNLRPSAPEATRTQEGT